MKRAFIRMGGFGLAMTIATGASAAPGSLDTTFSAAATAGQWGYSVAVQADGKVVAAGHFGVVRLLNDGSLDRTFSSILPGPIPWIGAGARVGAVAVQRDGRIVVTGDYTNSGGVALPPLLRLHADGLIDPSFRLDARAHPAGRVLALQPDGKIVTGGFYERSEEDFGSLIRLLPDGSLDPAWDARSYNNSAHIYSLSMSPEGRIYFGLLDGLFRMLQNGAVDGAFEPDRFLGPFGAVREQWDARVLVGQYGDGETYISMRRLLSNGLDDPDWAVPAISGGDHVIYSVLEQPDGKVLFGGNTIYGVNGFPVSGLARLHEDGSVDTSFNTFQTDLYGSVEDMAVAPDGRIVVAGLLQDTNGVRGVWRLHNDLEPRGIEFVSDSRVAREGDGWVRIPVRRTTGTNQLAIVRYAARPGSADRHTDYISPDSSLVFARGETLKHVRVYVATDRRNENFETVRLSLIAVQNGQLGPRRHAVLTILNR